MIIISPKIGVRVVVKYIESYQAIQTESKYGIHLTLVSGSVWEWIYKSEGERNDMLLFIDKLMC